MAAAVSGGMVADYGFAEDVASRAFRLKANGREIKVSEVPPMDAAERERVAASYRQLPEYCHIYDPAGMQLHFAHVGAPSGVDIEVEACEPIRTFEVLPRRRGIEAKTRGTVLQFTTGDREPRYLIVRINQLPPLMIAVDAPDDPPSGPNVFLPDLPDLPVKIPGSYEDHTEALQLALDTLAKTGGALVVPAGFYSVSQLHMRNAHGARVHLAAGCLIKIRPSPPGANEHRHGLWLEGCEDVSVTGRGCIDHQAYQHYALAGNDYQHGMVDYYTSNEFCPWITQSPLFMTGCRKVLIDGVTLRNSRNFNVNCRACDDVSIRRIKILTPAVCTPEYADGINTGSCRRLRVEECLVACNDDCFASGHLFATYDRRASADHVVRGLVGWTLRGSGARLGFFASYDQGDFTFEGCDFHSMTHTSLLIHRLKPDASGRPCRYGTIRATDCTFDARRLQFLLSVEGAGIDKLILDRVAFEGVPREDAPIRIEGSAETPIDEVELRNITLNGKPLKESGPPLRQLAYIGRCSIA